ncbi:hypothetical protein [Streptomyces sp. NPDC056948]|uniref:hypothetical protein n=1 Tax=Streptomyces sp. NPDC056948 TaxID=3345975 RepID=UPI00362C630C
MGSLRVALCTSVLVAAALTPAAFAADPGGVSVTPATPAPGSDVALRVTGCAARTAVAASAAFVADAPLTVTDGALIGESRVPSTLRAGTYTVKITCGGAERTGTFRVRESRESREGRESAGPPAPRVATGAAGQPPAPGTGGLRPLPEGGRPSPESEPDSESDSETKPEPELDPALEDEGRSSASRRPGAHASPVAPVEAGGGGAAHLVAAEDRGAGPGTAQAVTGLVLAGVAAVVVALGSVRRKRGTD